MNDIPVSRVALVTNNPAPYRLPVYNAISARTGIELHVIFCTRREPNREWNLPPLDRPHYFLKDSFITYRGSFVHFNLDVYRRLKTIRPDVVITAGFNPTHLVAVFYALRHGCAHVSMTDGTVASERSLNWIHRVVRRWVFRRSRAFVAAAGGGLDIYRGYGCSEDLLFHSPLCVDNAAFARQVHVKKRFDLLFCGRMTKIKNPSFVLAVAQETAKLLGRRISVCFVGSGPLESALRGQARALTDIDVTFAGFATQEDLPQRYAEARVLLLPSFWDPWGVVANEACAAGVPVISSPHAGVAGELIRDGCTGLVRDLDARAWGQAAARLLQDETLYRSMARAATLLVSQVYNFENAAAGIVAAVGHARRTRVLIAQRRLTHYRVPLFEALRTRLAANGVDLKVVYGNPTATERLRRDEGRLTWGHFVPCRYAFGGRLCWQNIASYASDADLLIVAHENKLLYNLYALVIRRPRRIAFWGHGKNFQRTHGFSLWDGIKGYLGNRVDWWFVYTSLGADVLNSRGFCPQRITITNNAVETSALRHHLEAARATGANDLRAPLGLGQGPIGVFIGSLEANKRLPFLIEACMLVRSTIPGFEIIIAGDGIERRIAEAAAHEHDFVKYVGVADAQEKGEILSLASILLNPGMIGLGILDAFSAGIPIITTDCRIHSPEIAYLNSGVNGVVTADSVSEYAAAIIRLLRNPSELQRLREGSAAAGREYTLEGMIDRFSTGILTCLRTNPSKTKWLPGSSHALSEN